jgi:hypothetical protein
LRQSACFFAVGHVERTLSSVSCQVAQLTRSSALSLTALDLSRDVLVRLLVNSATKGTASTENLLDRAGEFDRHRLLGISHGLGNGDDLVKLEITVVKNVLGLLSISAALLKSLDEERSSSGENGDSALSVLDSDLNLNLDALPLRGGLLNVFTDFLGRQTDRTALGGKDSSRGDFTTNNLKVNYRKDDKRLAILLHICSVGLF